MSYSMMGLPLLSHLSSLESVDWSDWKEIKNLYARNDKGLINYNCGSAGIQPLIVLEAFKGNQKRLSAYAPYEIFGKYQPLIKNSIQRLADLIKADSEEIALVRNTTEAINAVLYGIQWNPGDEILISSADYPLVWNTVNVLESRFQITIKTIKVKTEKDSNAQIVQRYKNGLSAKTRLLIATHITHREGHIMPVSDLSALGKQYGIDVLIDGAHGVGQIEVDVKSIGCQYYATSCLLYTSPSPRDATLSRMPSSA